MGKRGPAPTPTGLRIVRGDDKKNPQRVNHSEPVPASREVAPPPWLSRAERAVWDEYAPDLQAKGVLTAWDLEAFGAWCDAVSRRRKAARKLEREGEVVYRPVFNKDGDVIDRRPVKNPWMAVLKEADAQVSRHGARFGLTPSDRAQLKAGEGRRDPSADLLSG